MPPAARISLISSDTLALVSEVNTAPLSFMYLLSVELKIPRMT
jgi:hypothetical protein